MNKDFSAGMIIITKSGLMVIFFVISIAAIFLIDFYWEIDSKSWPWIVGIATNAVIAIMQFILISVDRDKIKALKDLKVTNVLFDRENEDYYGELINKANEKIDILGTTASRFMDDFANTESPRKQKKVLIEALERGVKVRILVASRKGLVRDDSSKAKAQGVVSVFESLQKKYPKKFEYGYFDHPPVHSIVRIDNDCIVGPTFQRKQSRHTPAIQMEVSSPLVKAYVDHFEEEWNEKKTNL